MDFTQQRHIPIAQENMQIEQYQSQPAEIEKYNPNIGNSPEIIKIICTLCQTLPIRIRLKNYNIIEPGFMMFFSIRLREVQKEKNIRMNIKIKS